MTAALVTIGILMIIFDESGILFCLAFIMALLFGASYVIGLGWHAGQ